MRLRGSQKLILFTFVEGSMTHGFHRMARLIGFLAIAASFAVEAGAGGVSAATTCPSTAHAGCVLSNQCSMSWAETACASDINTWKCGEQGNEPCCHADGYDCINWPFSGCDWGYAQMDAYCYGELP